MHLCFGLCFELIPATGEAHRKLADNNIILWPSYGNMALLLWRNMNIMAFRGSLGNYMAVMLLSFNRIFWFSIYPASLGGKSIKLFTFATICPGLLYIYTCDNVKRWNARHILRCHWVKVTAQWDRYTSGYKGFCETGRRKEQVKQDALASMQDRLYIVQ